MYLRSEMKSGGLKLARPRYPSRVLSWLIIFFPPTAELDVNVHVCWPSCAHLCHAMCVSRGGGGW